LVLGCCIWRDDVDQVDALTQLVEVTEAVLPAKGKWSVHYIGFSKNGWESDTKATLTPLMEEAGGKNWEIQGLQLVDLAQVDSDLIQWSK